MLEPQYEKDLSYKSANMEFIAESPTDIAFLLAEVERLKKQRDAYEKAANEWMNEYDKLKIKYEPEELIYD